MKAILVFNNMNDLVYWKWDHLFVKHVLNLATAQGLLSKTLDETSETQFCGELNPDIVIQIFSPIITSQRIMSCQFGNSYTSVQCKDGTNIVFDEFVGYLLVNISDASIHWMQISLAICISVIKYFCGPDVSLLKHEQQKCGVNLALTSWDRLRKRDQAALLGTSECLALGPDPSAAALSALKAAIGAQTPPARPAHAALFVGTKFLSLYSSRGAEDLTSEDLVFLGVLSNGAQDCWAHKPPSSPSSRSSSRSNSPSPDEALHGDIECEAYNETLSWTVILGGGVPHSLFLIRLWRGVTLILAVALASGTAAAPVAAAIISLAAAAPALAQRDPDALKPVIAAMEAPMKRALDALKKSRGQPDSPQRKLQSQWETLKRRLGEATRTGGAASWLALEGAACSLRAALKTAMQLAAAGFAQPLPMEARQPAAAASSRLAPLYTFLIAKAKGGICLTSSPTMNKYVEEFPGLVHFIHIDRVNQRMTAPALPDCSHMLSRKKIWRMVERGWRDLQAGHVATMWKDESLHYAHLVWWEDANGAPLKPGALVAPLNNISPHQYYGKLTEGCFPGSGASRARCWELFAIHLGLLPAGTALAHARRLAATVADLRAPPHPVTLL